MCVLNYDERLSIVSIDALKLFHDLLISSLKCSMHIVDLLLNSALISENMWVLLIINV